MIDKSGKPLFDKQHLFDDEIPKIFTFTKFNIKDYQGDFDKDAEGNPVLKKSARGGIVDN